MKLTHTLRDEATGAWRSLRYDLRARRAARLARAFTEEFDPVAPPHRPAAVVPVLGVTLLLAGGAAGAVLAVVGATAALRPDPAPAAQAAAPAVAPQAGSPLPTATAPKRALSPRKAPRRPRVVVGSPAPAGGGSRTASPVPENSTVSPSGSGTRPASASPSATTGRSPAHAPAPGR